MDPNELEFIAESESLEIIPRIKMDSVDIMETHVGPFYPNIPTEVPLWVALHLRKQQKCRIIPPAWMSVSSLTRFKETEDGETGCSTPPHPHYIELTTLILQHAPEDLPNHEQVRTLIKDLWDARVGKFIASVKVFIGSGAETARVSQLTSLELATVRNLLTNSLDQLAILRGARQRASDATTGLSQSGISMSV